jgi:hypothetical protein
MVYFFLFSQFKAFFDPSVDTSGKQFSGVLLCDFQLLCQLSLYPEIIGTGTSFSARFFLICVYINVTCSYGILYCLLFNAAPIRSLLHIPWTYPGYRTFLCPFFIHTPHFLFFPHHAKFVFSLFSYVLSLVLLCFLVFCYFH